MTQAVRTVAEDDLNKFLRWLESEPADEAVDDLDALRAHLRVWRASERDGVMSRRCLDAAAERGLDISARIRAQLHEAHLPLPRSLHVAATQVSRVLIDIARELQALGRDALGHRALGLCHESFLVSVMSAANPPDDLWRFAHGAAKGLSRDVSYDAMLLIAAAQPESFTARQLAWLADFLAIELAEVALPADDAVSGSVWWVDPAEDSGPVSAARKLVPENEPVHRFSAAGLARVLGERIQYLEQRVADAEVVGEMTDVEMFDEGDKALPPGLTPVEMLSLLRTLRERWASAPLREQPRRTHHYGVQVCLGLRALWELGRGRREAGRVRDWQVLNESPGGYAVMNIVGVEGEVAAGIVLGLRRQSGDPWTVCVVRWVRSDNPDQIELGLQVLALSYSVAQVAFRGANVRSIAPALMLPIMDPLRRHPAFIVPMGTYASRRFVFVRDGEHLYVAQGRALGLDMQTSTVELFQYEIDPYPI